MLSPSVYQLIQSKIRSLDDSVQDSDDSLDSLASIKNENSSITLIDLATIRTRFNQLKSSQPQVIPTFTVKANTDTEVLQVLADLGAHFNCISKSEFRHLRKILGAEIKTRVTYSSPAKSRPVIQLAGKAGVRRFTVGSVDDVKRVSIVPGAFLTIEIDSQDKVLSHGAAHRDQIFAILEKMQSMGSKLGGISIENSCNFEDLKLAKYATEIADQLQLTNTKPSIVLKNQPNSLEFKSSQILLEATDYLTTNCRIEAIQIAKVDYRNEFGDSLSYTLTNSPKIELKTATVYDQSQDYVACEILDADGEEICRDLKRFQRLDVGDWIYFSSDSCTNLSRNFLYVQ